VQFVVNEEGGGINPTVTRGVHKLLDEEALNAVQELECTPGKQRGPSVKVQMTLPVNFRLKDQSSDQ
jgi:protein TonB